MHANEIAVLSVDVEVDAAFSALGGRYDARPTPNDDKKKGHRAAAPGSSGGSWNMAQAGGSLSEDYYLAVLSDGWQQLTGG